MKLTKEQLDDVRHAGIGENWLNTIADLEAQLTASREIMACGHPKMFQRPLIMADNLDEGPQLYDCTLCLELAALQSRIDALEHELEARDVFDPKGAKEGG